MLHLPVVRAGRPYRSVQSIRVPHFRTKETFVELSEALGAELGAPLAFLTGLLGRGMAGRLDEIAAEAVEDLRDRLQAAWDDSAHQA